MIEQTFLHLPGVGTNTEQKLWRRGYQHWDQLHSDLRRGVTASEAIRGTRQRTLFGDDEPVLQRRSIAWIDCLDESRRALREKRYDYFLQLLKPSDHWRVLSLCLKDALYLDIETTGLSQELHYVTVIGASYRGRFYQWSWPEALDQLAELLKVAPLVVTFNGKRFDLPFLASHTNLPRPRAHVDLVFIAQAMGLSGGQKAAETLLGLHRPGEFDDFDGLEAVAAWCRGLYGDEVSYGKLLHYNRLDVELMPELASAMCDRIASQCDVPRVTVKPPRLIKRVAHEPSTYLVLQESWLERRAHFNALSSKLANRFGRVPRVVGIDLRAKEHRPTGWAVCDGQLTETRVLFRDQEILEATLAAKPDLVSIDAPLFLPRGRQTVSDDSPCRASGGIVRDAERILWSRRIPVYPALIRQMQGLTHRGIELTKRLNNHGVQVIESYPGAAQDILGIPRKKTDESLLSRGLKQFGFRLAESLTHDELDAVTSAMVAYFYLADEYEGIGSEDEGFMIIPRWNSKMKWTPTNLNRQVVSLLGLPGSGKSTLSRSLAERLGWKHFVLGDALRTIACSDNSLNTSLAHGEFAPELLVEQLVRDAATFHDSNGLVLDGFPRHAGQIDLSNNLFEMPKVLLLEVDPRLARQRLLGRAEKSSTKRPEDQTAIIDARLKRANEDIDRITPLIPNGSLIRVNGNGEPDEVVSQALRSLQCTSRLRSVDSLKWRC